METLLSGGTFFESPRWHDGRWWVSDFYRHAVLTVDEQGREEVVVEVEGQPSGLGWLPDGSLLVVSMRDRRVLRLGPDRTLRLHADLSKLCDWHTNDIVVAADGRAYVGNIGFDLFGGEPRPTVLVRVDPDGTAAVAANDLRCPNGMVITPDAGTLIVCETFGGRLTAFAIEENGSLTGRRVWAELRGAAPDGCALDTDGHVWVADPVGARCVRVADGGEVVDELAAPEGLRTYACMLGGRDGRTLLVCAAPDHYEAKRSTSRDAVLLTTQVAAPHAGLP